MSEQSEGTPSFPEIDVLSQPMVPSNSDAANSTEFDGTAASERESPSRGAGVNSVNVEALLTATFNFEGNNVLETSVSQQQDLNNRLGIHPLSACHEMDGYATGNGSHDDFDHFALPMFVDNNDGNQYNEEHSSQLLNLALNDDIAVDLLDIDNDSVLACTQINATHGQPEYPDGLFDLTSAGPTSMHADEVAAAAVREVDSASAPLSGQGCMRLPHLDEKSAGASTDVVFEVEFSSIMQGTSDISACAYFGQSHESDAETLAGNDDGTSAMDSTASDLEPRTRTDRYHVTGRGPQKCGTCGADRRGHECPYKPWNPEECKRIRPEWLAAAFYGLSVGSQESVVVSDNLASTERLEPSQENAGLIRCHDVAAGKASSNESESQCESKPTAAMHPNKTNPEKRTKSPRYNQKGRGRQKCGLCGMPRKEHLCIFPPSKTSASAQDFINHKTSEAFLIGLCLGERISSNPMERISSNNGNQSEVRQSEVIGQESQDEMENSDSGKLKRQRKK